MTARAAIIRPLKGRIQVIIPFQEPKWANRQWIKGVCGTNTRPVWNGDSKYWEVSRSHFPVILNAMLRQFGNVDIFEDHSEMEICNRKCQGATLDECVCRCLGLNHGIDYIDNRGDNLNPRANWHCIDEDTETLLGFTGVKRVHFIVKPETFKPIADNVAAGFRQYSYSRRYPVVESQCYICYDYKLLFVDHCHLHGWIRGRICSGCNTNLAHIERVIKINRFYLDSAAIADDYYGFNKVNQLLKCPDCETLIYERNKDNELFTFHGEMAGVPERDQNP